MRKYILIICLILSTFLLCSYKKYLNFGTYASSVDQVKQAFDDWCFYAVAEMARGNIQCDYASEYIRWRNEQDHIMDPDEFDCCLFGAACGGVALKRTIEYWNHIMGTTMRRWNNVIWIFNENTDKNRVGRPQFGLLDLRDDLHDDNYHAIWVFRVEITYSYPATSTKFTTYEVYYIDPWTGLSDSRSNTTSAGEGFSTVYVME